jgi:chorismate synthase
MLRFLTAGESHGPQVNVILEGIPAGLPLSSDDLADDLARRQAGYGSGPRMRIERDVGEITGGVMAGITIGAPIAVTIRNLDHAKWKGKAIDPMTVPRPGHADLAGWMKYGMSDLRFVLERASARETAARVAAGAICRKLLASFGVRVGSYVVGIGSVTADLQATPLETCIAEASASPVRCPNPEASAAMEAEIRDAMQAKDTLGGSFEVVALSVPPGLGSYAQWDRRLGARLAAAIMSIQAIKGVEIGDGFANARLRGTQIHDEIFLEGGKLARHTNRAGGLEGGITTGEAIVLRAAMKPISTTLTPLASVDLADGSPSETRYERSDFCSVPRATVVGEAMVCLVLASALLEKLGGDSIAEMRPRFEALRRGTPNELDLANEPIIFWE